MLNARYTQNVWEKVNEMFIKISLITAAVVVIEMFSFFMQSNCGNISMSCPYTPIFPKTTFPILILVWFGYICFMVGKKERG